MQAGHSHLTWPAAVQTTATDGEGAVLAIAAANMQLNSSSLLSSSSARPQPSGPSRGPSPSEQPVQPATGSTAAPLKNGMDGMLGRTTASFEHEHDLESSEQVLARTWPDRRQHGL